MISIDSVSVNYMTSIVQTASSRSSVHSGRIEITHKNPVKGPPRRTSAGGGPLYRFPVCQPAIDGLEGMTPLLRDKTARAAPVLVATEFLPTAGPRDRNDSRRESP